MKLTSFAPAPWRVVSFIGHTASGNGGVLTTTGNAATSVQVSDVTVDNSMAELGGAFELISSAFSCTRCVLTDTQARAECNPPIFFLRHLTPTPTSVQANTNGMGFSGGAFVIDGESRLSVIDSNFTNIRGGMTGGVFGSNSGILEISGSRFEGATALMGGALIAAGGSSTVTLRDSVLRDIGSKGIESWSWNSILLYDGPTATISRCRFEASPKGWLYVAKVRAPHPPHPSDHRTALASLSSTTLLVVKGVGLRRQLPL